MYTYEKKDVYNIDDLVAIMKILRADDGCPWDKVQTHESIREDFLEETCEAMEAIDSGNADLMKEEFGDVLLQVVFHSQIEAEKGSFDFSDVCDTLCRKLIERHPHVFSNVKVSGIDESLKNWDKIKKKEHGQESYTDTLRAVAKTFPSLMRAQKVGKRAMRAGLDYENAMDAIKSAEKTLASLKADIVNGSEEATDNGNVKNNSEAIEKDLGKILFELAQVSRKSGVNAEKSLEMATNQFIDRFEACENKIKNNGVKDMSELSADEINNIWVETTEEADK